MDPATLGLIAAGVGAAGSIGGGLLGSKGAKETKMQKTQRKLVDQLISSLGGSGPYADLYNTDENAFQKSFVQPALSQFKNQIAPAIQEQYITSGQQRGTGLDDQLLRAGVDLDSLLNQHMLEFQNQGANRKQNTINSILGGGSGAPERLSSGEAFGQSMGGYLSSPAFSDAIKSGVNYFNPQQQVNTTAPGASIPRKGFDNDWMNNQLGNQPWGQR